MQVDDFVGAGEARNCILPRETASGDDSSGNAAVSKDSAARRSSQIAKIVGVDLQILQSSVCVVSMCSC